MAEYFFLGNLQKYPKMTWYKNDGKLTKKGGHIHHGNFLTFLDPFSDIFKHRTIFMTFFDSRNKKNIWNI